MYCFCWYYTLIVYINSLILSVRYLSKHPKNMQRTDWAEKFVESFSSIPLTAECVYYSPKYIDKGKEKEVCDLLIILRGKGILVSMKAQQDPCSKNREKQQCWTIKNAKNAFDQAKGALKTIANKSYWCQHSRRGRIEFNPGEIQVTNHCCAYRAF